MRGRLAALAWLSLSCGRELVQTAARDPELDEVAPSCAQEVQGLPIAPSFSPSGAEPSLLTGAEYGAGEGPGLWLSARDAYRVYLNGALVGESATPRSADFIPLSLLPGDNILALVVWAERGIPAALVQLDDLSQSYVSDESWRVTTTPEPGFERSSVDGSGWHAVRAYGRLGSLPGCDPGEGFPIESLARWIGPAPGAGSVAALRRVIRISPVGYGASARGGGDSAPVLARNWQELAALASEPDTPRTILLPEGVHDFRREGVEQNERAVCPSACPEDPQRQLLTVLTGSNTCPSATVMMPLSERSLEIASNKTLVGLGRGALLRGLSLDVGASTSVIVRNVALYDVNRRLIEAGDAIGMEGASDVWIDHVTAKWVSDGMTDVSAGSRNLTFSWVHYDGSSPDACSGQHPRAAQITDASLTLQHCHFDHVDSHAPLVVGAEARVHILNSLIRDNRSYGVGSACGAQVLLEGNMFKAVSTPTVRRGCSDDEQLGLMLAPPGSNRYSDVGAHAGGDGEEPRDQLAPVPYAYDVLPAESAWSGVQARAGAGGPWARPLQLEP